MCSVRKTFYKINIILRTSFQIHSIYLRVLEKYEYENKPKANQIHMHVLNVETEIDLAT